MLKGPLKSVRKFKTTFRRVVIVILTVELAKKKVCLGASFIICFTIACFLLLLCIWKWKYRQIFSPKWSLHVVQTCSSNNSYPSMTTVSNFPCIIFLYSIAPFGLRPVSFSALLTWSSDLKLAPQLFLWFLCFRRVWHSFPRPHRIRQHLLACPQVALWHHKCQTGLIWTSGGDEEGIFTSPDEKQISLRRD